MARRGSGCDGRGGKRCQPNEKVFLSKRSEDRGGFGSRWDTGERGRHRPKETDDPAEASCPQTVSWMCFSNPSGVNLLYIQVNPPVFPPLCKNGMLQWELKRRGKGAKQINMQLFDNDAAYQRNSNAYGQAGRAALSAYFGVDLLRGRAGGAWLNHCMHALYMEAVVECAPSCQLMLEKFKWEREKEGEGREVTGISFYGNHILAHGNKLPALLKHRE